MSFFRAILAVLFGLGFSPLLIGMEKEQAPTTFKYSNPYFDPELQKSLTLIMLKNRDAQEVVNLDKDVLKIVAQNSYNFRKKELWDKDICAWISDSKESSWATCRHIMNNPERRKVFQGEEIDYFDFDFVTMNDEGREIFKRISYNIPYNTKEHPYALDNVYLELLKDQKRAYHRENSIFTDGTYNAVLKVPLRLRSKVGKLCTVKIIGEEEESIFDRLYAGCTTGLSGVVGIIISREFLGGNMTCGAVAGSLLGGGIAYTAYTLDRRNAIKNGTIRFKVVEKPLITPEEQKMIKQAEQEVKEREKQRAKEKEFVKFINKAENFKELPQELSSRVQLDLLSLKNRL